MSDDEKKTRSSREIDKIRRARRRRERAEANDSDSGNDSDSNLYRVYFRVITEPMEDKDGRCLKLKIANQTLQTFLIIFYFI